MGWKPDEVVHRPDGSWEERRWRRSLGRNGERSCIVKVFAASGQLDEIWHRVWDARGTIIHDHVKWRRQAL